jgi:hypothetical protein
MSANREERQIASYLRKVPPVPYHAVAEEGVPFKDIKCYRPPARYAGRHQDPTRSNRALRLVRTLCRTQRVSLEQENGNGSASGKNRRSAPIDLDIRIAPASDAGGHSLPPVSSSHAAALAAMPSSAATASSGKSSSAARPGFRAHARRRKCRGSAGRWARVAAARQAQPASAWHRGGGQRWTRSMTAAA